MKLLKEYSLRQFIGLMVISTLLLMENIDSNILNVAIPQMSKVFNEPVLTMKLAITSYIIGIAVFIPICGWISDKFGTQKTLLISITLFTLMSALCGMTHTLLWMVIFRLLQGASGAFMVPVGRLLLLKIFKKEQMVKAYTLMSMPTLIGPVVAPILGGYLVTYFSWKYIFWVNIPIGIVAFLCTLKFIKNYKEEQGKFNLITFTFLALFLCCFTFFLDIVIVPGANLKNIFLFGVGTGVFGAIYFFLEKNTDNPVIRYKLFKLRTFKSCFIASFIVRASLGGRAFILAIFLEVIFGLSAFSAGLIFIWMTLGMVCSRTLLRKLLPRYGFKKTITIGNIGSFCALMMLACVTEPGILLSAALVVNGIFASFQFMSMNVLYYEEVESVDYGSAVSVATTWQQLGLSIGIIVAAGTLHLFSLHGMNKMSFHLTFFILALINLSCQFMIAKLKPTDGESLMKKKGE
ncbi:MAG: MFS transporter [Fusobacteria bacterium]|nr:MFS transporter [Fusobacteriota bacterium]